jgi:hypothetical protein
MLLGLASQAALPEFSNRDNRFPKKLSQKRVSRPDRKVWSSREQLEHLQKTLENWNKRYRQKDTIPARLMG